MDKNNDFSAPGPFTNWERHLVILLSFVISTSFSCCSSEMTCLSLMFDLLGLLGVIPFIIWHKACIFNTFVLRARIKYEPIQLFQFSCQCLSRKRLNQSIFY